MSESHILRIFKKNLRFLREKHGYTTQQVGDACGVSKSEISRYENGLRWPSPEVLDKLGSLYQIRISALFSPGGAAEKAFDSLAASKIHALEVVAGMAENGEVSISVHKGEIRLTLSQEKSAG